jgi:hypothetical protein
VVLTVPQEIAAITIQKKATLDAILFRIVAETLHRLAADRRHLGVDIGFIVVLHRGARTPITTRISVLSYRAVDCRPTRRVGLPSGQTSSCLCGSYRDWSGGCFVKD